ncbi:MAG: CARDB domain-containing protein, partial [Segetibacter sp.]
DYYNRYLYKSISTTGYGKSITYNISEAINAVINYFGTESLGGRLHAEENTLHGDPAIKINSFPKPDFLVEDPMVQTVPNIISVADTKFKVKVQLYNIGKATGDSVTVQIRHRYPDGSDSLIYNRRIRSIRFTDSISIEVPIVAIRDKGENKIIVTVDADYRYSELSETNNTATNTFTIFEDELTPVYPYNFSIINKTNIKLAASTANPLVESRQYLMEIDTTENFNSSSKITREVVSKGGLIEFDPGLAFRDSTTYYWRVAPASSGVIRWNMASFTHINNSSLGFSQSHFFQHKKSATTDIVLDSISRKWQFTSKPNTLTIVNSVYPVSGDEDNHFS